MPTVKIEKDLYEKAKRYADMIGYSSTEEFVIHLLEKEMSRLEEAGSKEELIKSLQGLGYI
jgi:hypothetical protein